MTRVLLDTNVGIDEIQAAVAVGSGDFEDNLQIACATNASLEAKQQIAREGNP